ncbi:MAG: LysM peptidoglycan-binding domain-containing protein [Desulfobulbaceae bacterium]|nr:LysM peptidoglycan-binding domain-containing protein [Desulfobulbaceae bacterium]
MDDTALTIEEERPPIEHYGDNSLAEEVTLPEPEITVAEEIKELEALGTWEEGSDENIPSEPEITYDFPVTLNKQVDFYINFFQHKHKKTFTRWLERSSRYLPMIRAELRNAGLPEDLAYLPMIESGYSLTAYSKAKAAGPWQFIRSTGRAYDLTIDSYVDERRDPVKSTRAAIAFLSDLYDRFGDWQLAVAAYNAGGGKINNAIRRYKTKNFWEIAQKRYLKNETKRYVPKLIAAIILAKDPEKYGFTNINYSPPLAYETIEVPRWTSLRAVEVASGTDLETLRDLNRQLRQLITPPDQQDYPLRVPVGKKDIVAQNLPRVHTTVSTNYKTHVVGKNDTLNQICRLYNLNKTTLLKSNNLRKSKLTPGQRLRIPYQTTHYTLWDKDTPLPSQGTEGSRLVLHKIKPGESVSHIAKRYNVPVHLIAAWNDLKNINRIKAGQQLALYVSDTAGESNIVTTQTPAQTRSRTAARPDYYEINNGDSLWSIARRFQLTPQQLKRWNNLKSNLIHPGNRLRISDPEAENS